MAEHSTEGRAGFARRHQLPISWRTLSGDEQIMASDGDANNSSDFLNSGCAGLATVTEERHGPPKTYYSDPWFLSAKKQRLSRFPGALLVACSHWRPLDENDSVLFY